MSEPALLRCRGVTWEIGEKFTTSRRFHISSLEANAEPLLQTVQSHWSVENRLHWCMDVAFADADAFERELRYQQPRSPQACGPQFDPPKSYLSEGEHQVQTAARYDLL